MRGWIGIGMGWMAAACAPATPAHVVVASPDGTVQEVAPCATGCSGPTADEQGDLGESEIRHLMQQVAQHPVGAPKLALETLLFHGDEVRTHLELHGAAPLPEAHARWLEQELARDQVQIGLRLVAEDGTVLGHREDVIPLADKQHLLLAGTEDYGRLDVNGKVKRVGVRHLWARF